MSKVKPTTAELEVLNILWDRGPTSVRDVHKQLSQHRDVFYTTTLKTMQVMHNKGILTRDESARAHIYFPAIEKSHVERSLIDGLRNTLFSGSTAQLVISALGSNKPTTRELEEIKNIIDKLENDDHA